MNVLFVALSGARRHSIIAQAERVLADGGTVTVLIGNRSHWKMDPLPKGADVVELQRLLDGYRPNAVRLLLYRVPRRLLRVGTPGPLRGFGRRLYSAYKRRVARPVDRRLAGLYRRDSAGARRRSIDRTLLRARSIDLVVVGDVHSMVTGSELIGVVGRSGARLAYSIVHER